ncbi:exopolysaccharide biosynthesis protein [Horticoccus sp. 23ND18S-11]|uniref:exopolysaccharide biosynthesis protein n=1 Tax=Horticoccus sp. 23ND18S-11 TaxID=3391832 RepID=UPI0039C969AB
MSEPTSASLPQPPPSEARPSRPAVFSAELRDLVVGFDDRPVRLEEMLAATQGRGTHLLLLLIALPFVGPVPLPGFSIPFGLVVTLLGGRMALAKTPWLPRRLLRHEWPAKVLAKWIQAASRIMAGVEYFLRPRLLFVPDHAFFSRLAGVLIAVSGLMLMLPFPLPFSNSLPAWTVLLLAAGALGRDGLFFFIGCASFALSVAFFTLIAVGGAEAVDALRRLLTFH